MAFSDRFTGEGLVVKAVPTGGSELTLSTDYTAFSFSRKIDNVDVTAGNEQDKEKLVTKNDLSWSLDVFGGDDTTWDAFTTVKTGVMTVYRHGIANGLEYFSFNYVLEGADTATGTDKAETLTCSGSRSGSMVLDFGSVQGAVRHLVFTVQPGNTASGAKIASVEVKIEDPSNVVVGVEQSDVITITCTGSVASGVLTARVINGVAEFPGVVVTGTHSGATLTATSASGYTAATSSTFNVT